MTPFAIATPTRILLGRGEAAKAPALIRDFGSRVLIVHGANRDRAAWLGIPDAEVQALPCPGEPTLAMLEDALARTRGFAPQVVVALGGGAALDLGKALAALIPAPGGPLDHLEVVGRGLPLSAPPLPFVAIPTTAGTGAEATKNAVIGIPDNGRKVSLRDDRMLARLAIVDPALTDGSPRGVTLASGLDAVTQVVEPYVSSRATPFTDAIAHPAITAGMAALVRLMEVEDPAARDTMAWVSLSGGLALANGGLGAVHGLAGVIGGLTGAAHGAICGALLPHVLAMNIARAPAAGTAALRLTEVCRCLAGPLACTPDGVPATLARWSAGAGLPPLAALGVTAGAVPEIATAALASASMKGNPMALHRDDLITILTQALAV